MTSKQSTPAASERPILDGSVETGLGELPPRESGSVSFGTRLRTAREARGLSVDACAQALRLSSRVLHQLERDERMDMDYQVYLSSYIGKYARYLGLDEETIHAQLRQLPAREPTLVATGGISHSRYLLERYATAATYVVLTAVIVVPMVWLGVRGALDRDMSHLSPLDAAPVAQQDAPARGASSALAGVAQTDLPKLAAPMPHGDEQPLMASMVPSLGGDNGLLANRPLPEAVAQPVIAAGAAADTVGSGDHALQVVLANASWVEVTDKAGKRLEYGLLPAGSSKTYRSDQPLEVRIGNTNGAQVMLDGQAMPLDDFRHANVAHFRIAIADGKATPTGV